MDFEWDEEKAACNLTKHGIAFSVAMRVFGDEDRLEEPDAGDYDDGDRDGRRSDLSELKRSLLFM